MNTNINNTLLSLTIVSQCLACQPKNQEADNTSKKTKPLNVVFILSDDHRYDYMGFMHTIPWLETPNMDRMAKEGAHRSEERRVGKSVDLGGRRIIKKKKKRKR